MAAFGRPAAYDLASLLAGRPQPLGQTERNKSAVSSAGPFAAPLQPMAAVPTKSHTSGLLRAAVAKPAPAPQARPAAVTGGARGSVAPGLVAPAEAPKPEAATAPTAVHDPDETILWSAGDVPSDVAASEEVQATPFFLKSHHRVLFASPSDAMRVVVTALLNIDADVAMHGTPSNADFIGTLVGPSTCSFVVQRWALPIVEGFEPGVVVELRRTAGDKFEFHSVILRFNLALAAAAAELGVAMAQDVSDPEVAPLRSRSTRAPAPGMFGHGKHLPAPRRPTVAPADAAPSAPAEEDRSPSPEPSAEEVAALRDSLMTSYGVISSMLESPRDDIREEGAHRAVQVLVRSESCSSVCPEACRAALRERHVSTSLVRALVRAQCGSSCHSQAAMALAHMAKCSDCASDMIDSGAVEVLAAVIMRPCKRETIRLRRAAASALEVLASDDRTAAIAGPNGTIAYLRSAATACPDAAFRDVASSAAAALDPAGDVTEADAAGLDFDRLAKDARLAAYSKVNRLR